jgi:hypothetical protein
MQVVEQRYQNFKDWITGELAAQIPNSFLLSLAASVPIHTFLRELYEQASGSTPGQITDQVLAKIGLGRQDFTPAQIAKFQLYMDYFSGISERLFAPDKK